MTNVFVPYRNPVTGLAHHAQPGITKIPSPESLLFVGNELTPIFRTHLKKVGVSFL